MKSVLVAFFLILSGQAFAAPEGEIVISEIHRAILNHYTVQKTLVKAELQQLDLQKVSVETTGQDMMPGTENSTKTPRYVHNVTAVYGSGEKTCEFSVMVVSAELFDGRVSASAVGQLTKNTCEKYWSN
jgi:hypothetical protein